MKYTKTHEWLRIDGKKAYIGVTEHAQSELGDIVFVELPKEGTVVTAGKEVAVLESTKAAADVYAPVSGTVVAVNTELKTKPELINQSAEEKGWLYVLELSSFKELESLLDEAEYKKQVL